MPVNLNDEPQEMRNNIKKITNIRSIDELAYFPNLTHLTFRDAFNEPIETNGVSILPNSLTHLMFGDAFNEPIAQGVLPNSLTSHF